MSKFKMDVVGKFEGPKTQNKRPGIGAVDKIFTVSTPPDHNNKTLKFYLTAKVIFS